MAIRSDDQLENRFEPMTLPLWEANADMRSLLASFASSFPLHRRSDQDTQDMASYLLARSEGTIGELTSLRTEAAVIAPLDPAQRKPYEPTEPDVHRRLDTVPT